MSLPETTLANPLLEADYKEFLHHYANPEQRYQSEIGRLAQNLARTAGAPHLSQVQRHNPRDTPTISQLGEHVVPKEVVEAYLREVSGVVAQLLESLDHELKGASNFNYPGMPKLRVGDLPSNSNIHQHLTRVLYWLNTVDQVIQSAKSQRWICWQGGWYSRRVSLIPLMGKYCLLTTDACLMFKDMMYSRFLIHLYCYLDPLRTHLSTKLEQYVHWGANVLKSLGNRGYDVLKGIEALTQTALIAREETILDGQAQHQSMLDKYRDKEIAAGGTGVHVDQLAQYLDSFVESRDLAEAFGFLKLWGHPYVDPREGCVSAKGLAQARLQLNPGSCLRLEWSFCHLYCRGYLKVKGRWPPIDFIPNPEGTPTRLEELVRKEHPTLAFGFTQYPSSDWQWARFRDHIPFDEGEDILGLVVDRAISYKRSEFDASWPGQMGYRTPKATTSTRVLEELVTRPGLDLMEVVRRVAQRDIPWEWKIVTVSPKEREMKRDPRMFSMMVLEMRLFFVLTEHNIAEGIFRYLPEQTMTMSRQELLEVFLQSTRPLPGSWVRVVLGVDFSRWNLCWREESVHPIGRRLNEIYGTPGVFDVVHTFFAECMCLLRSGGYPPEGVTKANRLNPPEGRTLWYNHLGGFEGIAQKLWTTCTIALIHMALWHLGLSYRIIGQGDNQVCILDCYIPPNTPEVHVKEYIRRLVKRAAQSIANLGLEVGQVVKPEECIYSTCFLTYGKEMVLRGAYLPTSLKYISRMFPATTGDAPSLHEMVSSISSGAVGAPDRNDWSYPTWTLAKVVEGITLRREMIRSMLHGDKIRSYLFDLGLDGSVDQRDLRTQLLTLMISIPANLGGLPITTVPEIMYRGHSDPLASSLLHVCLMQQVPTVARYKQVLLKGWVLNPKPELEGLILDPYSIPLTPAPVPMSAVARETGRILPEITHNKQFSALFKRATPTDRERLFSWLATMRPFYPKLAHDIYKSSLIGLKDSFIKRFSNTRTILMIGRRVGEDLASVSLAADYRSIKRIIDRLVLVWKVDPTSPTFSRSQGYSTAVLLRRAWLKGAELEGVTNGHPLAVGRLEWFPGPDPLSVTGCRIQVMGLSTPSQLGTTTRGAVNPYLGSGTGDKAVAKWVRPVDSSPPLRDVLRLVAVRNMISTPGSALYHTLTLIAQSRSFIAVDKLEQLLKVRIGGTLAHRYNTRDDPRGSFWNSCFNWPSHLTISTNQAGDVGEQDYPFDFKEAMLSLAALTCWGYSFTSTLPPWGIQLVVDPELMDPVADRIVDSDSFPASFPPPADNYYSSVLQITLSRRAFTSARLSEEGIGLPFPAVESSVSQSVSALVLSHIRRGNPTTTRFGHTIGIPSSRRLIDLPELGNITTHEMLHGVQLAVWLKISYAASMICSPRRREPWTVIRKMWDLEVRRSVPALAATLRGVDHGSPTHGLGLGMGRQAELDSLARWMHTLYTEGLKNLPVGPFVVYHRGTASVSSILSSGLGYIALRECLSLNPVRFKAGKLLGRMTRAALSRGDEPDVVRMLCAVIDVCGLQNWFKVDTRSPEEVLREIRGREGEGYQGGRGGQVQRVLTGTYTGTSIEGGAGELRFHSSPLSSLDLVDSWFRRLVSAPAPAERWAPLRAGHHGPQRVLLVGVGSGDIGGAFPLEWEVTGIDLAVQLQTLGHESTTYVPPGLPGRFNLHQASWAYGGDICDDRVTDCLIQELEQGLYTLVVLDMEGVSTTERLKARHKLAQTGVPVYCKVLVTEEESIELITSYLAYRFPEDRIWTTLSYPRREFILGQSSAPMGLYTSVPAPLRSIQSPPDPTVNDFRVLGYPEFNPGADLLLLTGHMAPTTQHTLRLVQCRSLRSYIPESFTPPRTENELKKMCILLLDNYCPRNRVKSLVKLYRSHKIDLKNF